MTPEQEAMDDRREHEKVRREILASQGIMLITTERIFPELTATIRSNDQPKPWGKQYRNSIHRGRK
jgi:hypothetical protein